MALLGWVYLRNTVHAGQLLKGKALPTPDIDSPVLLRALPVLAFCLGGSKVGLVA